MNDEKSGGKPDKGADEVLPKWGSHAVLTLHFPPFPDPDASGDPALAPHDPVRARQVVEELGTVGEVLEQLPERPIGDVPDPEVRADLELVAVGCWGNVVHIVEPALGSDLLTEAMTEEIRRQRERHPQARIVGSLEIDYGNSYCEDVVDLPGGEKAYAGGWDCDDDWEFLGDAEEVLRAIGVDRGPAAEAGFDLDEEPRDRVWSDLGTLAIWGLHSGAGGRQVSVFRVRRTEEAAFHLEEVWFGR
ncbi:hypothetical protein DY245_15990 [Streptomyces inhibens]|uniref:Uncharacterized protein n=2 Tax=Streptomyces inhibens TaxID=2293571 RepID=A0A371Q3H7_STRIH|nr:hypothetical protein DY245_15990 [Streptomyces inhibens]